MPLSDQKVNYSRKDLRRGPQRNRIDVRNRYGLDHEPHTDYFYGFLCLIYDGVNNIWDIKEQMRLFFISSTAQLVNEDQDVEEYLQAAKRKGYLQIKEDETVELTKKGRELVEQCYFINLHTSYWMRLFFSEKTSMVGSVIFLTLLSLLKILTGLQLGSEGMLTEGFENLTDLIKIGIIVILGMKLNKDKASSIIIVLLMLFTGVTMVWSGIDALLNISPIIPSIQAYIIGFVSMALNGLLMFQKSMVGRISGNLSLLSDSKDAVLNVQISAGVLIGLTFAIFGYYFVDALIAIIIAVIIFKEGIEILIELTKKEEEFDIRAIKVVADNIYNNRLTGYLLASIRRERISRAALLENFKKGLTFGRLYYHGFADFFYDDLGKTIAGQHLDKLIKGKFIEIHDNELTLTSKGLKYFYKAKAKEFKFRSERIYECFSIRTGQIYCLLVFIIFILLIIFANPINVLLNSL